MKVWKTITPLTLAAIGILFFAGKFLSGNDTAALKGYAAAFAAVAVAGCIVIDILIKKIFKPKTGWLWIIELLIILVPVYLWIIQ